MWAQKSCMTILVKSTAPSLSSIIDIPSDVQLKFFSCPLTLQKIQRTGKKRLVVSILVHFFFETEQSANFAQNAGEMSMES